jgi:hypothetical protein
MRSAVAVACKPAVLPPRSFKTLNSKPYAAYHGLLLLFAVVPPGFYVPTAQNMQPCPDGSFRSGWVAQNRALNCTGCNGAWPVVPGAIDTINSTAKDALDHPIAAGGFVKGSQISCCEWVALGYTAFCFVPFSIFFHKWRVQDSCSDS